jgi:predicted nucleic acid-binding protein
MIVSDSTTLIILFDTKKIDLLGNLFEKIYIPRAVLKEINRKKTVNLPDYFEVCEVEPFEELKLILDEGESEAITLAVNKKLPLIIDEKKGRKIAKNYNVKIIGLIGILILNVQKGYLNKNEALSFLEYINDRGFRVSEKLKESFKKALKGLG